MTDFYCNNILLADGWTSNVHLAVDSRGIISNIQTGATESANDIRIVDPVIPGVPNCHSHAFQRAFAGLSEFRASTQDSFWTWRKLMYQFLQQLSPDDVRVITQQLYVEMLKSGYTAVGEFHYLHHDNAGERYTNPLEMAAQILEAGKATGIKVTLLPVLYRYSGFGRKPASKLQQRFILSMEEYIDNYKSLVKFKESSSVKVGIAPHSLRAVDVLDIQQLQTELSDNRLFHIHIAEQIPEVEECLQHSGQRPIEYLLDNISINEGWCLIHATHVTDNELSAIGQTGAMIGLCPTTEASLGDGIINPNLFDESTENHWCIGSDSHISVDPLEELRLLEYGQRLLAHQRIRVVTRNQQSNGMSLWNEAVAIGAKSIGHGGQLSVGSAADFLVLDQTHPSLCALEPPFLLDALIFSNRCDNPIKDVYVNGSKVIENGQHTHEETIYRDYQRLIQRLVSNL